MSDLGHEQTDKELKRIENLISKEYSQAAQELEDKMKKHFADFDRKDAEMKKKLDSGAITEKQYKDWRVAQLAVGDRWREVRDSMVDTLVQTDKAAVSIIQGNSIKAYGDNMNYGTYEIEHSSKINTGFSLYDFDTVNNLLKEDPGIVPMPKIDIPKDELWNRQKLSSAVLQGVLQGDSISGIADRLSQVASMDESAAIRNARTYTTAAENKGRLDSYDRANNLGIQTKKKWIATLDDRTRAEHRHLDGMVVANDDVFKTDGFEIAFPGDPNAEPEMFYNCRCTLVAEIVGYDYKDERNDSKLGDMDYEEWKHAKDKEKEEGVKLTFAKEFETPKEFVERNMRNAGHTDEEIKEFRSILDQHTQGGSSQREADKEIMEHINAQDHLAKYMEDKADLEIQAWDKEKEENYQRELDRYEERVEYVKEQLQPGGIFENYTEEQLRDWGEYPEKPEYEEPRFYRKGDMDGDVLAFSTNKEGAGMSFLTQGEEGYIGYDVSYTMDEMLDMGYKPVAGIMSHDVGMSGESEVLFVKFDSGKEEPAEPAERVSEDFKSEFVNFALDKSHNEKIEFIGDYDPRLAFDLNTSFDPNVDEKIDEAIRKHIEDTYTVEINGETYRNVDSSAMEFMNNQMAGTEEDKDLVNQGYCKSFDSYEINDALRHDSVDKLSEEQKNIMDAMDRVIEQNKLKEDCHLVRFADQRYLADMLDLNKDDIQSLLDPENENVLKGLNSLKGTILSEKAYLSTSSDEKANVFNYKEVKLSILAEKGTPAYFTNNKDESEVILGRNSQYVVEDVIVTKKAGKNNLEFIVRIING